MEKITLYQVMIGDNDKRFVQDVQAATFIDPFTEKQVWFVPAEDGDDMSNCFYEDELDHSTLFISKDDANAIAKTHNEKEDKFLHLCFEFNETCEKEGYLNPFVLIGMDKKMKDNKKFIENIPDKIFQVYANSKLDTYDCLSPISEIILSKSDKF